MQGLMNALVPLSLRAPSLIGLAAIHALLALLLVDRPIAAALHLLPLLTVALIASAPRLAYPSTLSIAGLGCHLLVLFFTLVDWSLLAVFMIAIQLFSLTLIALLLAESHVRRRAEYLFDRLDAGTIPMDLSGDVVARELRRSRRTSSPVSLVLLRVQRSADSSHRDRLIETLTRESREFDTVLEVSPAEVAVLCTNTNHDAAARWIKRLDLARYASRITIAAFPEHAVTSQGLFDRARRTNPQPAAVDVAVATVD